MFKKLDTNKAKQIYNKISHDRQRLRDSKANVKNLIHTYKDKAEETVRDPLSLLVDKERLNNYSVLQIAKRHPISTLAACFASGWLATKLIKSNKDQIGDAIVSSAKGLFSSNLAVIAKEKLFELSEEALSNFLNEVKSEKPDI